MSEEQNMSAWIRLMLQEIEQKRAEAAEGDEEAQRRAATPSSADKPTGPAAVATRQGATANKR